MSRKCPCGKPVSRKRSLCNECSYIYGERSEWPEWLSWLVADIKRVDDYERTHGHYFYEESILEDNKIDDTYELTEKLSRI